MNVVNYCNYTLEYDPDETDRSSHFPESDLIYLFPQFGRNHNLIPRFASGYLADRIITLLIVIPKHSRIQKYKQKQYIHQISKMIP